MITRATCPPRGGVLRLTCEKTGPRPLPPLASHIFPGLTLHLPGVPAHGDPPHGASPGRTPAAVLDEAESTFSPCRALIRQSGSGTPTLAGRDSGTPGSFWVIRPRRLEGEVQFALGDFTFTTFSTCDFPKHTHSRTHTPSDRGFIPSRIS